MNSYINNTRTDSILTINVVSADDLTKALRLSEVGNVDVYTSLALGLGINDIEVPAGKQLRASGNVEMSFVAVRSGAR